MKANLCVCVCVCVCVCACLNMCARCYTVVTLLLHYCYTVVTLLLHCCYTVVTLLPGRVDAEHGADADGIVIALLSELSEWWQNGVRVVLEWCFKGVHMVSA
jgi:hypothetical protein